MHEFTRLYLRISGGLCFGELFAYECLYTKGPLFSFCIPNHKHTAKLHILATWPFTSAKCINDDKKEYRKWVKPCNILLICLSLPNSSSMVFLSIILNSSLTLLYKVNSQTFLFSQVIHAFSSKKGPD